MSLPRASLASLAILFVLVSPACGDDGGDTTDSTTVDTTASTDDTTASTDDTTAGTGQPTTGEGDPGGAAIDAPAETWTWVPFPDAYCANGETTGIAVNLTGRSDRVVLYLEGGGNFDSVELSREGTSGRLCVNEVVVGRPEIVEAPR